MCRIHAKVHNFFADRGFEWSLVVPFLAFGVGGRRHVLEQHEESQVGADLSGVVNAF